MVLVFVFNNTLKREWDVLTNRDSGMQVIQENEFNNGHPNFAGVRK